LDMMVVSRERRCRGLLAVMYVVLSGFLCAVVARLHLSGVWGEADMAVLRAFTLHPAAPGRLMMIAWLTVAPARLSRRMVADVAHFVLQSFGLIGLFLSTDLLQFHEEFVILSIVRLVFACFVGNTKLVFVLNVVHSSCFFIIFDMFGHDLLLTLLLPFVCVAVSFGVEMCTRSTAVAQLSAMSSSQNETTVHGLLNILCDAVVLLDGTLCFMSPSPQLNHLLLRQKSQDVCGTSFPQLLCESDQVRFQQFVQQDHGQRQSLHIHMRDHCGTDVAVQLFHCSFEDLLAQTRHIIGIREEMDSEILRQSGSSGQSLSAELVSIHSGCEQQLAVWVDLTSEDLRIDGCTAHFTNIGGPIEQGTSFCAWVKGDRNAFMGWLQDAANDMDSVGTYQVKLAPPHQHNIEIVATCTVCVENAEDEDTSVRIGRIELSDVRKIRRPRPRSARGVPAMRSLSSSGSDELLSAESRKEPDVAVWIDFLSVGLPIVGYTERFTDFGGPMELGTSFCAWVEGDRKAFMEWLQDVVNDMDSMGTYQVKLTPPHQHNIEIVATCTLYVEDPADEDASFRIGCLELRNITRTVRPVHPRGSPSPAGCAMGSTSAAKKVHL